MTEPDDSPLATLAKRRIAVMGPAAAYGNLAGVHDLSGVSDNTWRNLVRSGGLPKRPDIRRKMEGFLGWPPGCLDELEVDPFAIDADVLVNAPIPSQEPELGSALDKVAGVAIQLAEALREAEHLLAQTRDVLDAAVRLRESGIQGGEASGG